MLIYVYHRMRLKPLDIRLKTTFFIPRQIILKPVYLLLILKVLQFGVSSKIFLKKTLNLMDLIIFIKNVPIVSPSI